MLENPTEKDYRKKWNIKFRLFFMNLVTNIADLFLFRHENIYVWA